MCIDRLIKSFKLEKIESIILHQLRKCLGNVEFGNISLVMLELQLFAFLLTACVTLWWNITNTERYIIKRTMTNQRQRQLPHDHLTRVRVCLYATLIEYGS